MNDGTWEKEIEGIEPLYIDWEGKVGRYLKDFISKELQRTRLETIEECEGVLPELDIPYSKRDEIDVARDVGRQEFREETLKNLAALKNTH